MNCITLVLVLSETMGFQESCPEERLKHILAIDMDLADEPTCAISDGVAFKLHGILQYVMGWMDGRTANPTISI